MSETKLHFDKSGLAEFLDGAFPAEIRASLGEVAFVNLNHVRMMLEPLPQMVRPGNIVSGPAQMALIDVASYAVVLAHIGAVPMAVTHSLNVTFMRACRFETIIADARLLKLGRRLATIDVRLWQGADDNLIAQSTVGYALP